MNIDNNKTFQDILLEFSQTPKIDVVEFTKKYEEVLTAFLELDEVYTVVSKASSLESIENNTAKPLVALNHKKVPGIWFFSEKKFAEKFANHFGLVKEGTPLICTVKNKDLIGLVKEAIFNGVYQFSIDEGKTTMVMVPYDLFNLYLKNNKEESFLEKEQYNLMILFTMMKFHGKALYAIESDEEGQNGKKLLAADRKGILNLFDKEDDANVHKFDIGYGRKDAVKLNIIDLKNAINELNGKVEKVSFEIVDKITEIRTDKLAYIINEMIKLPEKDK